MAHQHYSGKWIFYPWQKESELDHLILKEDLLKANDLGGIGICFCTEELEDWLKVKYKSQVIKVSKKNSGLKILPEPKFKWLEKVTILKYEDPLILDEISWHHKKKQYFYTLKKGDKVLKKRYFDDDLKLFEDNA